jgi:hypothetical protein
MTSIDLKRIKKLLPILTITGSLPKSSLGESTPYTDKNTLIYSSSPLIREDMSLGNLIDGSYGTGVKT